MHGSRAFKGKFFKKNLALRRQLYVAVCQLKQGANFSAGANFFRKRQLFPQARKSV
jgi:hypothetical protein